MIVLASNATGWDPATNSVIPGGMTDRYISPILDHLPLDTYVVARQPRRGCVNVYLAVRGRYVSESRTLDRVSVQLSHGIADKQYRDGGNMRTFDHVVVPGPAHVARATGTGVPAGRVHQLGYPKLDPVHRGEVTSLWPERDGRIRVLWAPTHGGGSENWTVGNRNAPGAGATTWWHRAELLALLDPDRFLVMEAPHPRHHPQKQATLAQYVGADVVIADGGSTIYEAWLCGLPVVLPAWITADRNLNRGAGQTIEAQVYRQQVGWHAQSPDELAELVNQAAVEGITEAELEFAATVLPPEHHGHGGKLHAEFLLELDETTKPKARASRPAPRRSGQSMKFTSKQYPQLQVPRARVRFRDGEAETSNPDAIAVLRTLAHMGVEPVDPSDQPAVEAEQPTAAATQTAPEPTGADADASEPEDDEPDGDSAEPEPGAEPAADPEVVPVGGAKDVLVWVADDPAKAARALEAEQARDKPRTTLVATLTKLAS